MLLAERARFLGIVIEDRRETDPAHAARSALIGLRQWRIVQSMEFGWHAAKSEATCQQRGFDFAYASRIFPNVAHLESQHRGGEVREKVMGEVDGLVLVVVFTIRGDLHWIISAQRANRKERRQWQSFVAR